MYDRVEMSAVPQEGRWGHINGDVHDLVERMGAESETGAKAAYPVRTDRLRDSTEHEVDGGTVRIGNGNDLPCPGYVKEGTRYMTTTPFLRSNLFEVRSL